MIRILQEFACSPVCTFFYLFFITTPVILSIYKLKHGCKSKIFEFFFPLVVWMLGLVKCIFFTLLKWFTCWIICGRKEGDKLIRLHVYKCLQVYIFTSLYAYRLTNLQVYLFTCLQVYKAACQVDKWWILGGREEGLRASAWQEQDSISDILSPAKTRYIGL